MLKLTARRPIVVATKIAVIVVPKLARAAVVQIAPPKLDLRVGLVVMVAPNEVAAKRVVPVVVDQKPDLNPEVPDVKDAQKVVLILVPNVVDQAEVALMQLPNHAALVVKVRQKVDETRAQNVDAMNVVRKLDRMDPDDAALVPIAHSLHVAPRLLNAAPGADVPISALVQAVVNVTMADMLKHTAVVLVAVR